MRLVVQLVAQKNKAASLVIKTYVGFNNYLILFKFNLIIISHYCYLRLLLVARGGGSSNGCWPNNSNQEFLPSTLRLGRQMGETNTIQYFPETEQWTCYKIIRERCSYHFFFKFIKLTAPGNLFLLF